MKPFDTPWWPSHVPQDVDWQQQQINDVINSIGSYYATKSKVNKLVWFLWIIYLHMHSCFIFWHILFLPLCQNDDLALDDVLSNRCSTINSPPKAFNLKIEEEYFDKVRCLVKDKWDLAMKGTKAILLWKHFMRSCPSVPGTALCKV